MYVSPDFSAMSSSSLLPSKSTHLAITCRRTRVQNSYGGQNNSGVGVLLRPSAWMHCCLQATLSCLFFALCYLSILDYCAHARALCYTFYLVTLHSFELYMLNIMILILLLSLPFQKVHHGNVGDIEAAQSSHDVGKTVGQNIQHKRQQP